MGKGITVGEKYREGNLTLGAIQAEFDYNLELEVDKLCKGGHNVFINAKIENFDVTMQVRHEQIYVEVHIVRNFMDYPEDKKQCRHKEEFVFTKNIDCINYDEMEDPLEDVARAIGQIIWMDCLSYVLGKRLEQLGWILEIRQPEIEISGRRSK